MKDSHQMADTFFDFSSLKNGEPITLPEDEDCLENEEEYDALNDETFGDLEDDLSGDDWEQQHEQFAEYAKTSANDDSITDSLKDLVLCDPLSLSGNSVWSYTPPEKNGELSSVLLSLQKASQSFVQSRLENQGINNNALLNLDRGNSTSPLAPSLFKPSQVTPKICTVEELEKDLLKSSKNATHLPPGPHHPVPHQQPFQRPMHPNHHNPMSPLPYVVPPGPMYLPPYQGHPMPRFMPGMPRMNMPPPMRHMPPLPMFKMMPPHPFLQRNMPMRPNPGGPNPYHMNPQSMPPYLQRPNMPPMIQHGNRIINPNSQHQYQPQTRQRTYSAKSDSAGNNYEKNITKDEYEGLMSSKEKQWLLNIQLLQLNTGTPYFDDYYYTIFKERKAKCNKENHHQDLLRYQPGRQRRNSDRQQDNPPTPRVYTPLQFENSLGKLQCGSVTAPRKIIDMDVVNCDKDAETSAVSSKDTRKTKQLLLELEMLFSLMFKAEDLTNLTAINNLKILRDIKQKQRLRELEAASTPEQKQEVLELVKKESEPVVENPNTYLQKILSSLLQEDKFTSFMTIRKGKLLLLRLFPVLTGEQYFPQVVELWSKLLLSIPIIGRRDTAGDNVLPKMYPLFKRYIQNAKMSDILENVQGLTEVNKLENIRSTPLSHQGKTPLYFVLANKFGLSAIAALCVRSEFLMSSDGATENQQTTWLNFIVTVSEVLSQISRIPAPMEGIPSATFNKICQRVPNLNPDKLLLLTNNLPKVKFEED